MIDQRRQPARSVPANRAESLSLRLLRERFEAMPAAKRQETASMCSGCSDSAARRLRAATWSGLPGWSTACCRTCKQPSAERLTPVRRSFIPLNKDYSTMTTDIRIKERPIIFSSPMVEAILAGRKKATRRVIKPTMTTPKVAPLHMEPSLIDGEQEYNIEGDGLPMWTGFHPDYPGEAKWFTCPYGGPGQRLWVKETFAYVPSSAYRGSEGVKQAISPNDPDEAAIYRAGWTLSKPATCWRSGRFMPRWASRITLEITEVRVQRLQDISDTDCHDEGIVLTTEDGENYRTDFRDLWDTINGRTYPWALSPWVWAISFTVVPQ